MGLRNKFLVFCAATSALAVTGVTLGASSMRSVVAQANVVVSEYRGTGSCSAYNYGVNIFDSNFTGHIDFTGTTSTDRESVGDNVSIKNGSGLKFGKSGAGGSYVLNLSAQYCAAYIWAAGWNGKTPTMSVNNGEVQAIAANTLVAGNPDCDIYYDRYAVNFETSNTLTITTTERVAIGGIAVYTVPFTQEELAPMYVQEDGPSTPEQSSSQSSASSTPSSSSPSSSTIPAGWAEATMAGGTNGSVCKVNGVDGIKVGTSSKGGDMTITVPGGSTKLSFYAAAWKGVNGLSLNLSGATCDPASIALTPNDGISNNTPFTFSGDAEDYLFTINLSDIVQETSIKLTSSIAKRFVVWGARYYK